MLHVVMQQHVYCLGYVSFVLVVCYLPGPVFKKIGFNQSDCFKIFRVFKVLKT